MGLSAVVAACPYDIPPHLPGVLMVLADHLHDPQPISATVKLVLQDFKRTHQDNWAEHKVGNMCVCCSDRNLPAFDFKFSHLLLFYRR